MALFNWGKKKDEDDQAEEAEKAELAAKEAKKAGAAKPAESKAAPKAAETKDDDDLVDPNKPVQQVTNDDLLSAWHSFSVDQSQDKMSAFLELLIEKSKLIVITVADKPIKADSEGHIKLPEDTEIQFPLMTANDGKSYQPFFTDWQAVNSLFQTWKDNNMSENLKKASGMVANFTDMATMVTNNDDVEGAVINPFEDNITLDKSSLKDLLKQANERHNVKPDAQSADAGDADADDDNGQIEVSKPQNIPAGFWAAALSVLSKDIRVQRAWLLQMHYQGQTTFFIMIDMGKVTDLARNAFFQEIQKAVSKSIENDPRGLNMATLDDDTKQIVEGADPDYIRAPKK